MFLTCANLSGIFIDQGCSQKSAIGGSYGGLGAETQALEIFVFFW